MLRRNVEVLSGERVGERFGLPIFPTYPSVTSRERLVRCLGELGEFEEAIRLGEDALRIAEELDHGPSFTAICLGLGTLYMRREDLERAIPVLERGVDVGRRGSIFLYVFSLVAAVGRTRVLTGRPEEGLALMTEVVEEAAAKHAALGQSTRLTWLAEGLLIADDLDRAWARGEEALELSRRYHEKGQEVWALHLLGDIAARRDPAAVDAAARWYRDALALAGSLEMRPAIAHCHLGLGELAARTGRAETAEEHSRLAWTLFREMAIDPAASARRPAAPHARVRPAAGVYEWLVPRVVAPLGARLGHPRWTTARALATRQWEAPDDGGGARDDASPGPARACRRPRALLPGARRGRADPSRCDAARDRSGPAARHHQGRPARRASRADDGGEPAREPAAPHDDLGLDGAPLRVLLGPRRAWPAWAARTGSGWTGRVPRPGTRGS